MKTMKTCKVGCGKMKAGGPIKKVKKMAPGGPTGYNYGIPLNGFPMRPTNGNTDISKNQMGTNPTMKKGGTTRMKKMMAGGMHMMPDGKMMKDSMMKKGGFPDLNKDGKISRADILKGRGVYKNGGIKKYQGGGSSEENPSGKSFGKQAGIFGGALAALVAATREGGIERRAKKAEERYDKRQVKKQAKLEAKNIPKSKMGGMAKSKKK
jgi:hypothetical protein